MNWDFEQLRILRALGHEPMLLATSMGGLGSVAAAAAVAVADARPAPAAPSLVAALVRAAGGRDISVLALDLERLRREPALKRALWPRLRALRREH